MRELTELGVACNVCVVSQDWKCCTKDCPSFYWGYEHIRCHMFMKELSLARCDEDGECLAKRCDECIAAQAMYNERMKASFENGMRIIKTELRLEAQDSNNG